MYPIRSLAGAALGGLGVTHAASGRGQVLPRLGKTFFKVTDLRLELVLHRCGLGGRSGRLSQGPFGIEFLPGTGSTLGCPGPAAALPLPVAAAPVPFVHKGYVGNAG